jgi:hypothetical protein
MRGERNLTLQTFHEPVDLIGRGTPLDKASSHYQARRNSSDAMLRSYATIQAEF